jgi:hypothetical protein
MSKQLFLEQNLKAGEIYAGLILGTNGAPDHHTFLLPGQISDVDWHAYMAWVKSIGGEAPTRRELSLLFANAPEKFDQRAYWSCETYESNDPTLGISTSPAVTSTAATWTTSCVAVPSAD